jgi:hypothetical protein
VTRTAEQWTAIELGDDTELIVGWRPKAQRLTAERVDLHEDVATELRALCRAALRSVAALRPRPYAGSPQIEPDEEYLAVAVDELPPPPPRQLRRRKAKDELRSAVDDANETADLVRLVATAPRLETCTVERIRTGSFLFYAIVFYAIVVSDNAGQRFGFVKRWSVRRLAKEGRIWTQYDGGLRRLAEPDFIFEPDIDLIVAPDEIAVLNQLAFEPLLSDLHLIAETVPGEIKKLAQLVPFHPATKDALEHACKARPSLAKRLRRLNESGGLTVVDVKAVAKAVRRHHDDPKDFIDGQLVRFDAALAPAFLDLIEGLYYEADFTDERRRADRYSRR